MTSADSSDVEVNADCTLFPLKIKARCQWVLVGFFVQVVKTVAAQSVVRYKMITITLILLNFC